MMIRKSLLTAALILPLVAMSGVTYAGPGEWEYNMRQRVQAQAASQQVVSKPYAQYVAPQAKVHWTGPKHNQYHVQRQ